MDTGRFVGKMEERRGKQSINEFARSLGINGSLWSRIIRGKRRPGRKVVDAALARWPELAYYLAEDAKASQTLAADEF